MRPFHPCRTTQVYNKRRRKWLIRARLCLLNMVRLTFDSFHAIRPDALIEEPILLRVPLKANGRRRVRMEASDDNPVTFALLTRLKPRWHRRKVSLTWAIPPL